MVISYKWCVLWSLWAAALVPQPTRVVRVSAGLLRGAIARDGSHEAYLGIPYATADRFQAPKPVQKWNGIFNAYEENIRCKQRFFGSTTIAGTEDCQTLNVYTPLQAPEQTTLRPVMVFIHGGGFRDGSGAPSLYGPEFLVKHDVILVTFNYRLEVIGFLCLGIPEAPGNAGMKDQVEALKWVKKNIKAFGGDPDNVTVFGESAGASSVSFHLISPMSKGLFNKAIIQSGSALAPWSLQYKPIETASLLAKHMNYDLNEPSEIFKLFKSKSAEELLKTRVPRKKGDTVVSENIFVPCIEKQLPNIEPFLTHNPFDLMSQGLYTKVPILIGYNNEEGLFFAGKENDTTIANLDFTAALPRNLEFDSEEARNKTGKQFKNLYLKGKKISKDTIVEISRFEGESQISYPTVAITELFLKTNDAPVFSYKFYYDGHLNLVKLTYGNWKEPLGATHADDLFYMFKPKLLPINRFLETDMVNRVTTLWTNFAKYGNPTPDASVGVIWEPASPNNEKALVIDKELKMAPLWDNETLLQWNRTYIKFRKRS